MRFKVDENLPVEIATVLRQSGHDAETVQEENLGGFPDTQIGATCQQEERCLITLDLDFADIRAYPPSEYPGIIVFRLMHQDKQHVLSVLARAMHVLSTEPLHGHLWVVDERRIKIRGESSTDVIA